MITKFISEDGTEVPIADSHELLHLVTSGRITGRTMVFDLESSSWKRAQIHTASRAALDLYAASSSPSNGEAASVPVHPVELGPGLSHSDGASLPRQSITPLKGNGAAGPPMPEEAKGQGGSNESREDRRHPTTSGPQGPAPTTTLVASNSVPSRQGLQPQAPDDLQLGFEQGTPVLASTARTGETSPDGSQSKEHAKGSWRWLFDWRLTPAELEKEITGYSSAGLFSAYRKIAGALWLLTAALSVLTGQWLHGWTFTYIIWNALLWLFLALFCYRGHRWAFVLSMILWTAEKGFQLPGVLVKRDRIDFVGALGILVWWGFYVGVFWRALTIERERRRRGLVVTRSGPPSK